MFVSDIVDINFDLLIKMSAKFLQCKVAIFPFPLISVQWGGYFKTLNILFLIYFFAHQF